MFKANANNNMAKTQDINAPERLNRIVDGTVIEGTFNSQSNIRVDGTVTGTINTKGRLVVGPKGRIEGDVICNNAEVEGVVEGKIKVNDEVQVFSSKEKIKIIKILTPKGESDFAVKGQAVTLTLDKEVDISRGDLLCSVKNHNYFLSDQFASHIIWMNKEQMIPERNYIFKFINFQTIGKITDLVHKININSFEKIASKFLNLNEIGYAKVALNKNTIFNAYKNNKKLGEDLKCLQKIYFSDQMLELKCLPE